MSLYSLFYTARLRGQDLRSKSCMHRLSKQGVWIVGQANLNLTIVPELKSKHRHIIKLICLPFKYIYTFRNGDKVRVSVEKVIEVSE